MVGVTFVLPAYCCIRYGPTVNHARWGIGIGRVRAEYTACRIYSHVGRSGCTWHTCVAKIRAWLRAVSGKTRVSRFLFIPKERLGCPVQCELHSTRVDDAASRTTKCAHVPLGGLSAVVSRGSKSASADRAIVQ